MPEVAVVRRASRWARLAPACCRLVCQRSVDQSRCCSSAVSCRQRPWETSPASLPISRPPQSTPSIGAPVSRSALVTSTRPSSSTTAPQAESRGRLSSVASSGSSRMASPSSSARSPPMVASMARRRGVPHCGRLHASVSTVQFCPPGGIGRRAGFRYQWLWSWGFKSPGGHHHFLKLP